MTLLCTHDDPRDNDSGFLTVKTYFEWDRYRGRKIYLEKVGGDLKVVGASFWID